MSKNNNVNPDHYKEAGRERTGKGLVHGDERAAFERTRAETPHIPNQERAQQERAPQSSPSGLEEEPQAADDTTVPTLTDDEGLTD